SRRVFRPVIEGSRAGPSGVRRRDGAVRSAGRRVPGALRRLLRSGLRLFGRRRPRLARRARSALARGAVYPRARPDRRAARLREDALTPRQALRRRYRLELPGAGIEALEAFSIRAT